MEFRRRLRPYTGRDTHGGVPRRLIITWPEAALASPIKSGSVNISTLPLRRYSAFTVSLSLLLALKLGTFRVGIIIRSPVKRLRPSLAGRIPDRPKVHI